VLSTINIKEITYEQAPMSLLLDADPSETKVRSYLVKSKCFAAMVGQKVIGVCVVLPLQDNVFELMNIAVTTDQQAKGIGSQLLSYVVSSIDALGASTLVVGTGTFGYQLAFYQRSGFRVTGVERDFFLTNYDEPIIEQGIQLKDMLRLEIKFEH